MGQWDNGERAIGPLQLDSIEARVRGSVRDRVMVEDEASRIVAGTCAGDFPLSMADSSDVSRARRLIG